MYFYYFGLSKKSYDQKIKGNIGPQSDISAMKSESKLIYTLKLWTLNSDVYVNVFLSTGSDGNFDGVHKFRHSYLFLRNFGKVFDAVLCQGLRHVFELI